MPQTSTQMWETPAPPIPGAGAISALPQVPFSESAEPTTITPAALDAHAAVFDALRQAERAIAAKRLKVSVRLLAGNHYLNGDRERLRCLVRNLVGSAVATSPVGGQLTVRSTRPSDCALRIEIEERSPWLRPRRPATPAARKRNARE